MCVCHSPWALLIGGDGPRDGKFWNQNRFSRFPADPGRLLPHLLFQVAHVWFLWRFRLLWLLAQLFLTFLILLFLLQLRFLFLLFLQSFLKESETC